MVNRTHGVDTENAGIGIVISNVNESHSAGAYHRIISVDPSGAAAQTGMIREFVRNTNHFLHLLPHAALLLIFLCLM
jgi:hypothetical protein